MNYAQHIVNVLICGAPPIKSIQQSKKKRKELCLDKPATTSPNGKGGTYFPNYHCKIDLTCYYLF